MRNAVVSAAEHLDMVKEKASEFTRKAETTWEESKPGRTKAKNELKKAADRVVGFGKDVQDGLTEGFAEVHRRNAAK